MIRDKSDKGGICGNLKTKIKFVSGNNVRSVAVILYESSQFDNIDQPASHRNFVRWVQRYT
jgi:hypothetical protein